MLSIHDVVYALGKETAEENTTSFSIYDAIYYLMHALLYSIFGFSSTTAPTESPVAEGRFTRYSVHVYTVFLCSYPRRI